MPQDKNRKDSMMFALTDTNVFIHYEFFKNVDWAEELGAREVTLDIPPVVLEELDKRKWAGTRREKERAKTVLRALKELGLSTAPVQIRPGVSSMALDDEPDDVYLARHRLQARAPDDRLLASALAFKEGQLVARVLVLTADTGLSIKACRRGRLKSRCRRIALNWLMNPTRPSGLLKRPAVSWPPWRARRRSCASPSSVVPL